MKPSSIHRSAVAAALLAVAAQAHATTYRVIPRQAADGPVVECSAINARGDTAGTSVTNPRAEYGYDAVAVVNGTHHSYGWSHGQLAAEAYAINAHRVMAGDVITDQVFGYRGAALWFPNGDTQFLPALEVNGNGTVFAVNDAGRAVGSSTASSRWRHATLWVDGLASDLAPDSGSSTAAAINRHGDVVGTADNAPVRFKSGKAIALGTLGGHSGGAYAINEAGHIVGDSTLAGETNTHAFLFKDGTMRDLGAPAHMGSSAWGINRHDTVVGDAVGKDGSLVALIWQDGVMQRLDDLIDSATGAGWIFYSADAINDAGQICAFGNLGGALLTPMP